MKTTLSAGKRLADDEAARLLDAANGRVNEGGGNVSEEMNNGTRMMAHILGLPVITLPAIDPLARPVSTLLDSVDNFHRRYGTASKPNAVENQTKAFAQESGEYIYAIAAGKLDQGAKELADVLYTVFGVAMLAGITREQLAEAMYAIAASNDAKTVENGWNWNARGTKVEKLK